VGLIPTLSSSLYEAIPTTGLLVTAYALGIALGGPVITPLTARVPSQEAPRACLEL
jgi:MFS transporter, DHA1 family, inner membrane transport protein